MIPTVKLLNSSTVQCAEIVTSNVINNPPSIWKKCKIQWGMGMENSQDCVIGVGRMDRFVRQFFLWSDVWTVYLVRSDKCGAHNLLKPEVLSLGPRWKIRWYVGIYQRRDETESLWRPDLYSSTRCIIPYYYSLESSSLYTRNTSWYSVYYMILNKPLVRLTTAHYQSAVSMISFAQVLTAQWSDTIPCWNVQFQVGITSHDILFQQILDGPGEILDGPREIEHGPE